jgi:hypothetical protein
VRGCRSAGSSLPGGWWGLGLISVFSFLLRGGRVVGEVVGVLVGYVLMVTYSQGLQRAGPLWADGVLEDLGSRRHRRRAAGFVGGSLSA